MRISEWSSDVCSSDLNVFDNNGTANVMIVGYRYEHKDPKYQPLPKQIVVRGNQHGKAGYAPKFPGGDQIAAAMGGSIPPILWDGAGDAIVLADVGRSEERRVRKECVSTCRSQWAPTHKIKLTRKQHKRRTN